MNITAQYANISCYFRELVYISIKIISTIQADVGGIIIPYILSQKQHYSEQMEANFITVMNE